MIHGLGGMVWQLREWEGGVPEAQVAQCRDLGLSHVSIKILDGTSKRWERESWFPNNQNEDLIDGTLTALRSAGIQVSGWGWTYGVNRLGLASVNVGRAEATATVARMRELGLTDYLIDAEHQYQRANMGAVANVYCETINREGPELEIHLCSYRFPLTYQRSFPVHEFAMHVDGWAPQVYFLEDNRLMGGATQLEISYKQHIEQIRDLPFVGVAPTYPHGMKDKTIWRASRAQLLNFFTKAKALGCPGALVWALEQASIDQLEALRVFEWTPVTPPPSDPIAEVLEHLRTARDSIDRAMPDLDGAIAKLEDLA